MHLLTTSADAHWNGLKVVAEPCPEPDQKDRIIAALDSGNQIPRVDEETLVGTTQEQKTA